LPYFNNYYFLLYGSSLKINVLGKIFGQRKRRFRCFTLAEGLKFSTQDAGVDLSYSLAQSWNMFGSFGIKVWIYKSIVKRAGCI
jgi:ribosomal protein S3